MRRRSFLRGLLWTLVGLLVVFHVAGGWYFSGVLIEDGFMIDPDPIEFPRGAGLGGFVLEEVTYESDLGEFDAWYLPSTGDTWVVHVHGKGATPREAAPLFAPLQDAGYPQLAITYRNDEGQPADPSGYYQYGATEWEDIGGAFTHAVENGATGVVFFGFSTGAAHVLNYVYRHGLGEIEGLVLDSGNLDMSSTVDYGASQRDVPFLPLKVPPTLSAVAKFITSLRIGVNWQTLDYIRRAEESLRVPVILIHGDADERVPLSQSVRFAEAVPERARLVVFEGAGHVDSYDVDRARYLSEVMAFLEEID